MNSLAYNFIFFNVQLFRRYVALSLCFIFGFFMAILYTESDYHLQDPQPLTGEAIHIHEQKKLILLWREPWYSFKNYDLNICPFSNCTLTLDRFYFQRSHAVIFPGVFDFDKTRRDLPKTRPPNQYWIYQNMESQLRSRAGDYLRFLNGKINLTMTFLHDSDIAAVYGSFRKRRTAKREILLNKTKLVAWVVSNCFTPSKREVYFRELQKHIQADVFGKCNPTAKYNGSRFEYISRNYKFYFAAENSLCKDYLTEKVYRNAMSNGMIPIVYGGANYSRFLPVKSYIDVKDFRTPKELATYLKVINNNNTLYNEYFKWREELEVVGNRDLCHLCEILHKKTKMNKVYNNLHEIWTEQDCISSELYLKNIM